MGKNHNDHVKYGNGDNCTSSGRNQDKAEYIMFNSLSLFRISKGKTTNNQEANKPIKKQIAA
jgi:hypothetical protein